MKASAAVCEFCRQPVEIACSDPPDCVLGHQSKYVSWRYRSRLRPGKYRFRLASGAWCDGAVSELGLYLDLTELTAPALHIIGYTAHEH